MKPCSMGLIMALILISMWSGGQAVAQRVDARLRLGSHIRTGADPSCNRVPGHQTITDDWISRFQQRVNVVGRDRAQVIRDRLHAGAGHTLPQNDGTRLTPGLLARQQRRPAPSSLWTNERAAIGMRYTMGCLFVGKTELMPTLGNSVRERCW